MTTEERMPEYQTIQPTRYALYKYQHHLLLNTLVCSGLQPMFRDTTKYYKYTLRNITYSASNKGS
jgi:hypothetical protein